ncbi:MFS family permease [Alkalihalobacillus xiaoxiensis]|uniref:MFS family permease n=1 Tax=Shouchella xiaoxiensis TaxID=766895 RepID=A0ABS2SP78_9BACI|nr:MFS transporter [Shouchella xiaoxiensis]MBM7837334.1 MFS family permease [Shouchella xiaoxiensis]
MSNSIKKDVRLWMLIAANFSSAIGMGILSIGVAWLILEQPQGEKLLGIIMVVTTILIFFGAPYIGSLVDRFSRKRLFQLNQVFIFLIVFPIALFGYWNQELTTWQLLALYIASVIYYSIHYPTMLAFVQEIFDSKTHNRLNGVLEIQSQAASMIAGGLAGILFQLMDPARLLMAVAIGFVMSFVLLSSIPYQRKFIKRDHTTIFSSMFAGVPFIKQHWKICLSIFALTIPFLTLMVGNYLRPVFIQTTLEADASIYGFSNMIYSIGAVLAGIFIPIIYAKWGPWIASMLAVATYTVSLVFIAVLPFIGLFLFMQVLTGIGNAGSRICKQNLMMAHIPNAFIGRVNGIFEAVGTSIRLALLLAFTYALDWISVQTAFFITAILSFAGLLFLIKRKNELEAVPEARFEQSA